MSLPTRIPETQQAVAVSSPSVDRRRSSDSYWMALVSIDTWAQNRLKPSGSVGDHNTVRLGSGAGPRLYSVCRNRKLVRVTSDRPSDPTPPMASVTHVGSPE